MLIRLLSIASIAIGATLYVLWRPGSLLFFAWLAALGLDGFVGELRGMAAGLSTTFPGWVYFSLPQGLWVLGGCLAIHSIWRDPRRPEQQFWMFIILLLAVGGELGQALGFVQGIFDPIDLALIFIAFMAAQLLAATGADANQPTRAQV